MNAKQELKKVLNEMLGSYVPNKVDLENLTNYLYKITLNILKESNIKEELSNVSKVNELDEQGFIRAIHTIALSASSNVLYATMQKTFKDIKNRVDLIKVNADNVSTTNVSYIPQTKNEFITDSNEGTFEFDLSQGQVSEESRSKLNKMVADELSRSQQDTSWVKPQVQQPVNNSYVSYDMEFDLKDTEGEATNTQIPSEDLTLSAGSITSSMVGKAPKFSGITLDY